jgi:hypothetical protein
LNNLGSKLESRFDRLGTLEDLEAVIQITRKAVEATPDESPDLTARLYNLGRKLARRFERLLDPADESAAISAFRKSYDCSFVHPLHRLYAARYLLRLFKQQTKWQDAVLIAEPAVRLLPLVQSRALNLHDQ